MNPEKPFVQKSGVEKFVRAEPVPAVLPHPLEDVLEKEKRLLKSGAYFEVYDLEPGLSDSEKGKRYVFKDFRSGDLLKRPAEQAALFQHQYYEWNSFKKSVGEKFFPESFWIRSGDFTDDEAHGFYAKPGKTANTVKEFVFTQLDKQLADRYGADSQKNNLFKKTMAVLGKTLRKDHGARPFIGGIIQERIRGVPFSEALQRLRPEEPAFDLLKENTRELLRGLRRFHEENDQGAFTWHGLASDNVVAEVDERGQLTGEVYVLDANFTERPTPLFRKKVLQTLEKKTFDPLEQALGLSQE